MSGGWAGCSVAVLMALAPSLAVAQSCTTQAKLNGLLRSSLAEAALSLANDVKSGNVAKLKSEAIEEYAANFSAASTLIQNTAGKISGDTLQVAQIYVLDARNRKSADQGDADFSCPLTGSTSETDFSIAGLPPGMYAFVMVEANGPRPWLVSMLLRQETGHWKLAGLYPHARTAAGEDGLWYWKKARYAAKANQLWYAWLLYDEAEALLKPSNFTTSTNLDKLQSERRSATPSELADGIGSDHPLVIKGADGTPYRLTGISSEGSEDGRLVNVVVHYAGDASVADAPQEMAKNAAVAAALIDAHKDLREGFDGVIVIADVQGRAPFVTEQKISEIH
ncbi:hypothetical protein GOB94_03015 [Granulicella sp. 5B5]|uniref:hypothetical protein n=1 Tax=Granulicella sp. 5B5 TaxID=1617967 RepID=UPI0015F566CC|nr:hypothetical protein [Granulicella sp. 5B5]QMV17782.1 hypothetical protein GOB94_03015 [Granulicella sp. 5B5]